MTLTVISGSCSPSLASLVCAGTHAADTWHLEPCLAALSHKFTDTRTHFQWVLTCVPANGDDGDDGGISRCETSRWRTCRDDTVTVWLSAIIVGKWNLWFDTGRTFFVHFTVHCIYLVLCNKFSNAPYLFLFYAFYVLHVWPLFCSLIHTTFSQPVHIFHGVMHLPECTRQIDSHNFVGGVAGSSSSSSSWCILVYRVMHANVLGSQPLTTERTAICSNNEIENSFTSFQYAIILMCIFILAKMAPKNK